MGDITVLTIVIILAILAILVVLIRKCFRNDSDKDIWYEDIYNFDSNLITKIEEIHKQLNKSSKELLKELNKKLRWINIWQVIFVCILIISIIIFKYMLMFEAILGIILSCIMLIILWSIQNKYKQKNNIVYKEKIMNEFVSLIDKKMEYMYIKEESQGYIGAAYYIHAGFDEEKLEKTMFDRMFKGTYYKEHCVKDYINIYDNPFVEIFDLHTIFVDEFERKDKFDGVFVVMHSSVQKDNIIKISKNKKDLIINKEKLQMDSGEFERYFDVYAQDKVVAMQLLTSDVIESLIDFYNKYKIQFEIVFKDMKVYFRFFTGKMFNLEDGMGYIDKRRLYVQYNILNFISKITKEIKKAEDEMEKYM